MKLEEEIKQSKFRNEYHKLAVNLIYTGGWINISQVKFLRGYKLSPQQFNVLRILRGQYPKPASVNLLIERMLDKTSNASRLVDKLEDKSFVEKHICPNDKRQLDVIITKKGLKLLSDIDLEMDKEEAVFSLLSEQEAKTLNHLLDKLRG